MCMVFITPCSIFLFVLVHAINQIIRINMVPIYIYIYIYPMIAYADSESEEIVSH